MTYIIYISLYQQDLKCAYFDTLLHPLSCPSIFAVSCHPCSYTWRTTEWSDCRVDVLLSQQDRRRTNMTGLCGGGLQTREVFCVQANAELLKYLNNLKEKDKGRAETISIHQVSFFVLTSCSVMPRVQHPAPIFLLEGKKLLPDNV